MSVFFVPAYFSASLHMLHQYKSGPFLNFSLLDFAIRKYSDVTWCSDFNYLIKNEILWKFWVTRSIRNFIRSQFVRFIISAFQPRG